jgi:hypothetical protein
MRERQDGGRRRRIARAGKFAAIAAAPFLLGGCAALPLGVQVASYFADGVLYLTTKKTITDHGLSLVTNMDCSIWRGLSRGELCREPTLDEIEIVVERAPVKDEPDVTTAEAFPVPEVEIQTLARLDATPAASAVDGGGDDGTAGEPVRAAAVETAWVTAPPAETDKRLPAAVIVPRAMIADAAAKLALPAEPAKPVRAAAASPEPASPGPAHGPESEIETLAAGTYLVIGSFRAIGYAERLAADFDGWPVLILPAQVGGRQVYRVALGPVAAHETAALRARLAANGIRDSWALEIYETPRAVELAALNAEDSRTVR